MRPRLVAIPHVVAQVNELLGGRPILTNLEDPAKASIWSITWPGLQQVEGAVQTLHRFRADSSPSSITCDTNHTGFPLG